nr:sugar-binding protein [Paenibacillus hamazuiensis]
MSLQEKASELLSDSLPLGGVITKGSIKPFDVVTYRPTNSPLENHHGILDVWASKNIASYQSRAADTPAIALTEEQHAATKKVYRDWLVEKTGKRVGGRVDLTKVTKDEVKKLSERMFDAAGVPQEARDKFYKKFEEYIGGDE